MKNVNSDDSKPSSTKKLKQATLPFFALSNKTKSPGGDLCKKRKKSESDSEEIKVLKVLCNDKNNSISESTKEPNDIVVDTEKETKVKESDIKILKDCNDENSTKECSIILNKEKDLDEKVEALNADCNDEKNETCFQASDTENIDDDVEKANATNELDSKEEYPMDVSENQSSPLPHLDASAAEDEDTEKEEEEDVVKSSDMSMNVSALLEGGDDKDSVISFSDIPLTPMKTPNSANKKPRKLTPKQIEKQKEIQKRKEEKEREKAREKEERERKKQEEKESRKRQREEREEQKRKEKLEREKKRQEEIDQKNEEKRLKEEERRKKEEEKLQEKRKKEEERALEKRRREEEKLLKDEEKKKAEEEALKKKEKAAAAFASFFVPKKSDTKKTVSPAKEEIVVNNSNFMPFQVKADMKLAPTTRISLGSERKQKLEKILSSPVIEGDVYLQQLRSGVVKPARQGKTWPYSDNKDDIAIIEEVVAGEAVQVGENSPKHTVRAKLLQFHENRRPPYWGTWRKKSLLVRPRRPLGLDKMRFDYEVDSDDEWEEEEPGESIKGSEDEAEKESEDDYEVDNEFFVPHGYLSEEEAGEEEAIPPEAQKERLKMLEKEFNAEMKEKKQQLKPRILGIFFHNDKENKDPVYNQLMSLMKIYAARRIPTTIPTSFNLPSTPVDQDDKGGASGKRGARARLVPEEAIPNLIRLIHGNTKSQRFLAKEFVAYWQALKNPDCEKKEREDKEANTESPCNGKWGLVSIANASRKIKELASWRPCPDEGPLQSKLCWYVPLEVRQAYGLSDLTLPNQWHYTLAIKKKAKKEEPKEEAEAVPKPVTPRTTPSGSLITKFTKKMSDEERKKQIKRKSATPIITSTPKAKPKLPDSPFGPLSAFCKSPSTSLNRSGNSPSTSTLVKAVSPPTSNKPEEKKGRRVSILVSVPRGQEIPTQVSSQARPCSNFPAVASTAGASESKLKDQKTVEDKKMSTEIQEAMDVDCVTLD